MNGKRAIAWIMGASLIGQLSCNLPMSVQGPTPVNPQSTLDTVLAPSLAAVASDTPALTAPSSEAPLPSLTPTPSATPSPTYTFTPTVPMVSVSGNTNCRTGPGTVYDLVFVLTVGQTAQVVGRDGEGQYWVIRNPSNPANSCWLWGNYATVTGDWSALPVIPAPPTPTPAPSFAFSYDFWGVGPGYQCFKFDVRNTGSVIWESYTITLHNTAHGTTATGSGNEFISYDNWCVSTGSESDLMPGETGMASVITILAYNPAGEAFDATLKLCSENGLGGTCVSQTVNFTP